METEMREHLGQNWGWIVMRGVVAVLFGVLALTRPSITLAALVFIGVPTPSRKASSPWPALGESEIVADRCGPFCSSVTSALPLVSSPTDCRASPPWSC
jgi:hypothetical protein